MVVPRRLRRAGPGRGRHPHRLLQRPEAAIDADCYVCPFRLTLGVCGPNCTPWAVPERLPDAVVEAASDAHTGPPTAPPDIVTATVTYNDGPFADEAPSGHADTDTAAYTARLGSGPHGDYTVHAVGTCDDCTPYSLPEGLHAYAVPDGDGGTAEPDGADDDVVHLGDSDSGGAEDGGNWNGGGPNLPTRSGR